jgi:hypothetical protein
VARKSENFQLVLVGGGLGLWILFHTIWSILFEDWIKHQLERFVGHTVAEMMEKFGSVGFPAIAAIAIVWFLYAYIRSHLKAELVGAGTASPPPEQPKPSVMPDSSSWPRDTLLGAALWRVCFGNWTKPKLPELIKQLEDAGEQIRQRAYEGLLPVWARKPKSTLYEPVPASFWRNHAIIAAFSAATLGDEIFVAVTTPLIVGEVPNARSLAWTDFMTSKEAVEKLWPEGPS